MLDVFKAPVTSHSTKFGPGVSPRIFLNTYTSLLLFYHIQFINMNINLNTLKKIQEHFNDSQVPMLSSNTTKAMKHIYNLRTFRDFQGDWEP